MGCRRQKKRVSDDYEGPLTPVALIEGIRSLTVNGNVIDASHVTLPSMNNGCGSFYLSSVTRSVVVDIVGNLGGSKCEDVYG